MFTATDFFEKTCPVPLCAVASAVLMQADISCAAMEGAGLSAERPDRKGEAMDVRESYAVLELPFGASLEEVKKAYRKLVRVWHPDRFANDPELSKEAEQKLRRLNEAYQSLESLGELPEEPAEEGEVSKTYYRDASCWYLGGDLRMRGKSFGEFGGRRALVEVTQDGVTLVTVSGTSLDEAVHYPASSIRELWCGYERWVSPERDDGKRLREPPYLAERQARLIVTDPEEIISRPMGVLLKFRNAYFAKLFAKRIRTACGLRKPQASGEKGREQQKATTESGAQSDLLTERIPDWVFWFVVLFEIAMLMVLFAAAG